MAGHLFYFMIIAGLSCNDPFTVLRKNSGVELSYEQRENYH